MDTGDAQQKVDDLDESAKSLQDRLQNVGSAGRSMGEGIGSGIGQGMSGLDSLGGAVGSAAGALNSLGQAGADAGGKIQNSFENAADASDSLGTSFAKNYTQAIKSGQGFASSIKTGIVGAVDTAKKRMGSFVKDTVDGAKKTGNAFLHPIDTIKNKFTGAMKDASKSVDTLGDEADRTEKELDDMGSKGGSAGDKLKNGLNGALKVLGAIAAAAVVVTGIAKFTTAALDASQAANQVAYSFEQTFGENAPDVLGWAENFAQAVGRGQTEVKSFLTSNQQLYKGLGITGQAANDLSKMTTSLAYDIGNITGLEDAEALSRLQDAITGNDKALADLGVSLDKTTLQQTAMGMGLGKNLDAMDEATLAQVRFNSIMEQTGKLQQNASKSLGGVSGGVKTLQAHWTSFLEKAGNKLAPTFEKIFGVILDAWPQVEPALLAFVDLLASGFEQAAPVLGEFATNLLPQILNLVGMLTPILVEIGGQLLPVLAQVLGTVFQAVGPLLSPIETLARTLLPPLVTLFGSLVEKLLPPLATLFEKLSPIIDALSPVIELAAAGIGLLADGISTLINWLITAIEKLKEFGQMIQDSAVGQFVTGVGEGISNAWTSAQNFFSGNAKGTESFSGGWTRVNETGGEMIQAKYGEGLAFLPRGSSIIPASKTEELLSQEKPSPGWIPRLIENNPIINLFKGEPQDEPDGNTPPPPKPPPPPPEDGDGGSPRKVIDLNITISSPDGSLPPEALEAIRRVVQEVVDEREDTQLTNLAIQNGMAG